MTLWTIRWLKKIDPQERLKHSVRLFWISLAGGTISTVFVAQDAYERILMAISWGAITITCVDVIVSTDVRDELRQN